MAAPPHPTIPAPIDRRSFLRRAVPLGVAPFFLPVRGQTPEPLEIALIGLHGHGSRLLREFLATGRVVVTWLCDVDRRTFETVTPWMRERQARPFRTTHDLRQLLDDRRLQAVVVATPDHWSAVAGLRTLQAGKHLYLESPGSHNPRETEWLIQAARRSRTVVQCGLQRRSLPWVIEAVRRLQEGAVGMPLTAHAWHTDQRPGMGFGRLAPVPDWLEFGMWQGPAPDRPFRDNLVHGGWRWMWHWGTGELGATGIHWLDLARWALDLGCPSRVASAGMRAAYEDDQETADTQVTTFDFGERFVVWEHRSCLPRPVEGSPGGVRFQGTSGSLVLDDAGYRIEDREGRLVERVPGTVSLAPHVANFLDAVTHRGRLPSAGIDDGQLSALWVHLGNLAQRLRTGIHLNAATRQPRPAPAVTALWSREYRSEWRPTL
ncbi:MAG: Gfo/Idh/MocA family oxidoreductase [Verrucomicrobiae bacterium]|nr:Gfo/Idh/MocA family oxidoreductase [Verrucomicrobiae bacterium]